jgi:gliding motility-associated-like protein
MKIFSTKCLILLFLLFLSRNTYACNIAPTFTYKSVHTCGLPTIVTALNTSSGSQKNTAKYWWKADNVRVSDTITGLDSVVVLLKSVGNHKIKLYVRDSSGCIDSSSASTINVVSKARSILGQNGNYTLNPSWMNCLQFITDPDTFSVAISSLDTLKNVKIFWGDGSSDLSGGDLAPNNKKTHLYTSLGINTIKIVTTNGSCTDTTYGTVYNQRQPTAGIVGPPSGSNRGCVPHTLKIVNNSYNISDNTTFNVEWGNGDAQSLPYTSFNDTLYHTYTKGVCAGVIKITATNVCGSSFTTWNPIDISDRDKARWAMTGTCDPTKSYIFQNLSSDLYCLNPDIKEYFWDFGDGTTVGWTTSKADQYHKYKTEGDYIITLIAKSACGNDTFKDRIRVFYNPVAAFVFDADRGCKPLATNLTDTSKGRSYTRNWTMTEGSTVKTSSDSILNYLFTTPGTNTISLKVTNVCGSSTLTRNFIVNDKPKASFAKIDGSCVPMMAAFTNTSTSYFKNPSYSWDFGDSTFSNVKIPTSKKYTVAGNYTVKLIVTDSCGTDTFSQTFTAFGLPKAILSGDTTGCTFDSLSFVNQSINSTNYSWDFGDNQTLNSSVAGITKHMYTVTGPFKIRLISGTGSGCKDTAFHTLNIKPGAKAQFDINKSFGCSPATFKFTNNSIYGKDFFWYANGKLISTKKDLSDSILKTDSAVVNLKLIATSASSCQGDSMVKVYFTPKNPKAIISGRDSGCGILKVTFRNASTNTVSSFWNLGNGNTSNAVNPATNYAAAKQNDTIYYPELKVKNWAGCRDSVKTDITVYPAPSSAFSMDADKGCGPLKVNFTNESVTNNNDPFNSLKFSWDFGKNKKSKSISPSESFYENPARDTVYNVSLKVTTINGCVDSASLPVRVYPKPTVKMFADNTSGCSILPVSFTNQSSPNDTGSIAIMTFRWNSGNGKTSVGRNFNASYKAAKTRDTTYKVKLVGYSEHGCKDSITRNITVHPDPIAKFTLNRLSGCTPLHVTTINQSVAFDGGPLSHEWSFGNTFSSTEENDSTIYINNSSSDQSFTVNYEAVSQYGCRDTASQQLVVRPKPVARFSVSTKKACAPVQLKVTDNSVNGTTYFWGQGAKQFTGAGSEIIVLPGLKLFDTLYTISHQVASAYGCLSDTVYDQVLVLGRPEAEFEYAKDSTCARENINIVNTSLGGYKYTWKFGDGTSASVINPKHRFPIANNGRDTGYNVQLYVVSSTGCSDTAAHRVHLVNRPMEKIVLDKTVGCTDLEVSMSHASSTYKTLYWDFGDNSGYGFGDKEVHTYINPMSNLTMQPKIALYRQRFNCMDTASTTILVYPKPVADFKTQRNDPCDAGTYQFINKSKNNISNQWLFNDGKTVSASSFSAILTPSKQNDTFYSVTLFVTNAYKCKDSTEQIIKVKPKLNIRFKQESLVSCEKGIVAFENESVNAVRYFWKFGDGGLSNEKNPSYTYDHYGNYRIMLYGYDRDGCVDSSDGQNFYKVLEKPKADFTYLPNLPKLPSAVVDFKARPTIVTVNESDLVYEWNFGDYTFPTANKNEKDPSHTYTRSGTVEVTLTVWNNQCSDMVAKPIYIEDPKPEPAFTADVNEGCAELTVKFRNTTINATSYRWIWGDGSPDSYEKEPVHVFKYAGQWDVTLIATGTGGVVTLNAPYFIKVLPRPDADFYANKQFLNLPNAVFKMQNNSNNAIRYDWKVYDSFQNVIEGSTLRDPSFFINEVGFYSVRLIATNSFGCTDTMMKTNYLGTYKEGYVYVPNAFSPNRNGRNDDFKPSVFNVKPDNYVFRIYNRWGQKVFETNDLDASWDGTYNGVLCEQETYVWSVNGEYISNDLFALRGTLTLLR